jgi:hypothetical protein
MKATIKKVQFNKEYESKFGTLYSHKIWYDKKMAFYSSKSKDQNKFVPGQEAEFTEEVRQTSQGEMIIIKPLTQTRNSNFGRALKREQSKYSGFSDSYVKDLLSAGVIRPELTADDEEYNDVIMATWKKRAFEIFEHMVELDKSIES